MSYVVIKSLLMILASIVSGTVIAQYINRDNYTVPAVAWFLIVLVTFVFSSLPMMLLIMLLVILFVAPSGDDKKVYFYLAVLPVLPIVYTYDIPFPGINYLFSMSPLRFLNLVLLFPIYLRLMSKERMVILSLDRAVLVFCLLQALMLFRDTSFTNGMRNAFYVFADIWVPYIVISRLLRNAAEAFGALLYSGLILMVLALLESRLSIKAYTKLLPSLGVDYPITQFINYRREYGIRVQGSLGGPIPFGYFLAMMTIVSTFWAGRKSDIKLWIGLIFVAFIAAILFTGSRGALMTVVVGGFAYYFYLFISKNWYLFVFSLLAVIFYFFNFGFDFLYSLFDSLDPEGTFRYRLNLIENSLKVVDKNFFFGDPNFIEDPDLAASKQGQGIIDIVNTYLQVVLNFGVVGLVSFLSVFYLALRGILIKAVELGGTFTEEGRAGIVIFSLLMGSVFLIATCSAVNYIPVYYWVAIAMSAAYLHGFENEVES